MFLTYYAKLLKHFFYFFCKDFIKSGSVFYNIFLKKIQAVMRNFVYIFFLIFSFLNFRTLNEESTLKIQIAVIMFKISLKGIFNAPSKHLIL